MGRLKVAPFHAIGHGGPNQHHRAAQDKLLPENCPRQALPPAGLQFPQQYQLMAKRQVAVEPHRQALYPMDKEVGFKTVARPGGGHGAEVRCLPMRFSHPLGGPEQKGQFLEAETFISEIAPALAIGEGLLDIPLFEDETPGGSVGQVETRQVFPDRLLHRRRGDSPVLVAFPKIDDFS